MTEWIDEPLDKGRICKKRRRRAKCAPQQLAALPAEWRELLARWVRRGGNSRWETLAKDAGSNRVQLAHGLLDWLLGNGWASVVQHWKLGDWFPQQVELSHLPQLRAELGVRDKENDTQRWLEIRASLQALQDTSLAPALCELDELPVQRALSRHDLILKLHDWKDRQQSGTRRNFALFARDDTKAISEAEWDWLESVLDLAEFGIERHTPLLLVAAPLVLQLPLGKIDLSASPDFVALTPAALQAATIVSGQLSCWKLVENRTSFEKVVRQREADIGVVWLPGFPPGWWRETMGRLLDLAPAPADIACDPDPAGIAIALQTSELWAERKLDWQPWRMSASDLASLSARKPLTELDRQQLTTLQATPTLPPMLAELATWMAQHGEKGEQEGYL